MTLNFKKLIRNQIKKQMAIQHWESNVQIFKRDELPDRVTSKIKEVFGENYILDADYLLFFSGHDITKELAEKTIFKISNKALGEAANNMTENDIKVFGFKDDETSASYTDDTTDDVDRLSDPAADDANAAAIDELTETVENPEPGEKFAFLKITMR